MFEWPTAYAGGFVTGQILPWSHPGWLPSPLKMTVASAHAGQNFPPSAERKMPHTGSVANDWAGPALVTPWLVPAPANLRT